VAEINEEAPNWKVWNCGIVRISKKNCQIPLKIKFKWGIKLWLALDLHEIRGEKNEELNFCDEKCNEHVRIALIWRRRVCESEREKR
jgi:hypothetical protein